MRGGYPPRIRDFFTAQRLRDKQIPKGFVLRERNAQGEELLRMNIPARASIWYKTFAFSPDRSLLVFEGFDGPTASDVGKAHIYYLDLGNFPKIKPKIIVPDLIDPSISQYVFNDTFLVYAGTNTFFESRYRCLYTIGKGATSKVPTGWFSHGFSSKYLLVAQ